MALPTPEKLAESGSEDGTQKAYIQACRTQIQPLFPEVMLMYHVPNGGQRGAAGQAAKTMAGMKAMGLVNGVPDICLPVARLGFNNLYIEFKRPDGTNGLDPEQFLFIVKLTNNGNLVAIMNDWHHAYQLTLSYLQGDEIVLDLCNTSDYVEEIPKGTLIDIEGFTAKLLKSAVWRKFNNN